MSTTNTMSANTMPEHWTTATQQLTNALCNDLNTKEVPNNVAAAIGDVLDLFADFAVSSAERLSGKRHPWIGKDGPASAMYAKMNSLAPRRDRTANSHDPETMRWTTALRKVWRSVVRVANARLRREAVRARVVAQETRLAKARVCARMKVFDQYREKEVHDARVRTFQMRTQHDPAFAQTMWKAMFKNARNIKMFEPAGSASMIGSFALNICQPRSADSLTDGIVDVLFEHTEGFGTTKWANSGNLTDLAGLTDTAIAVR
jgi:hypothetical protein